MYLFFIIIIIILSIFMTVHCALDDYLSSILVLYMIYYLFSIKNLTYSVVLLNLDDADADLIY